jgi:alkanesulfonate monooxygenase SsuD/methylene tetrahydromethanopterin reductase-like flavin-dependent oxidoreductase (luciferase family)
VTGAALVTDTLLHLAVALDGAGRHARADAGCHPAYWAALARTAERGLLDLVTIGDTRPVDGGHPDPALVTAYLAPLTRHVGLVPVLSAEAPQPVAAAVARLDRSTRGRGGWQPSVAAGLAEAVPAVHRLWDAWAAAPQRERVQAGATGPSVGPRPPQGRPPVLVALPAGADLAVAARVADVVLVTVHDAADAAGALDELRAAESAVGRTGAAPRVLADVAVALDGPTETAAMACSPAELADLLVSLWAEGLDGARLRPATLPGDLLAIVDGVVPALQHHGVFRTAYGPGTLRARLGLRDPSDQVGTGAPDTMAV